MADSPVLTTPPPPREFSPFAAALAWLWPGLGHISLGETKRGVLIMVGVLFLFFSGLLVGGVTAVDRREERLWFLAQGLCGPIAFGADYVNQNYIKRLPPEAQVKAIGLGHVSEIGTLFVALAGLMNLVVILDALHFAPRPAPERRQSVETGSGATPQAGSEASRRETEPRDAEGPEGSGGAEEPGKPGGAA